jgi:hypothetical protein
LRISCHKEAPYLQRADLGAARHRGCWSPLSVLLLVLLVLLARRCTLVVLVLLLAAGAALLLVAVGQQASWRR